MADTVIVRIDEEYGYQDWWVVYTREQFEEAKRRWQTMKGLSCLVPVDLIFPGARGCFGEWPPKDLCRTVVKDSAEIWGHVHQPDDSHFAGLQYDIPEHCDAGEDWFEIDGKTYSPQDIDRLREESRKRRDDDYFALHPEHAHLRQETAHG